MKITYARPIGLAIIIAIIIAIVGLLAACSSNPIAAAKTVDAKAYALYGTFVALEEQGASLVQAPGTPVAVKAAIKRADAAAKPVADGLITAAKQYSSVQAQLSVGATTNDKLQIATANLEKWITDATPLIQKFVAAIGSK